MNSALVEALVNGAAGPRLYGERNACAFDAMVVSWEIPVHFALLWWTTEDLRIARMLDAEEHVLRLRGESPYQRSPCTLDGVAGSPRTAAKAVPFATPAGSNPLGHRALQEFCQRFPTQRGEDPALSKPALLSHEASFTRSSVIHFRKSTLDRLCDPVVRVPGYRSRVPGSIHGAIRYSEK
jgi:hypothetical protein